MLNFLPVFWTSAHDEISCAHVTPLMMLRMLFSVIGSTIAVRKFSQPLFPSYGCVSWKVRVANCVSNDFSRQSPTPPPSSFGHFAFGGSSRELPNTVLK